MLASKKEELRREIARRERELEGLEGLPDLDEVADGTVLALFVTLGRSVPYIYVAYRTRGKYYLTGKSSPNAVTADALAEWLTSSGRRLVAAAVVGSITTEVIGQTAAFNLGEALVAHLSERAFGRAEAPDEVHAARTYSEGRDDRYADGPWGD